MVNTLLPYKNSIKTITRDNGTEFAEHQYISQKLGCDFYFAILIHCRQEASMKIRTDLFGNIFLKEPVLRK